MLHSGIWISVSPASKTAVLTLSKKGGRSSQADIAAGFQAAVVDVLAGKCMNALADGAGTLGHRRG